MTFAAASASAFRWAQSCGEQATLDRAEVVQHVEQHGELGEGVECPGCAVAVHALVELETDERRAHRTGEASHVHQVADGGGVEQPLDRSGDFGEPQVQTLPRDVGVGGGGICPAASSCAITRTDPTEAASACSRRPTAKSSPNEPAWRRAARYNMTVFSVLRRVAWATRAVTEPKW